MLLRPLGGSNNLTLEEAYENFKRTGFFYPDELNFKMKKPSEIDSKQFDIENYRNVPIIINIGEK